MMPSYAWHALREAQQAGHVASMSYLERLILYKLRTTDPDELHDIAEIGQGLEHRLYKAKRSASLEELLQTIRTKRYPMARLRRILLHILLDIRTADIQNYPAYGRILAFNDTGREILRKSGCCRFPIRWQNWHTPAPRQDAVRPWNPRQPTSTSWHDR